MAEETKGEEIRKKEEGGTELPDMDDKLDEKGGMKFKDWWAILLSTLAFTISAAGFFINTLQQTDDLRVIVETPPNVRSTSKMEVLVSDGPRIIFLNSGNQSAAILRMEVYVTQIPAATRFFFCTANMHETKLVPFVIKPGEVIIETVSLEPFELTIAKEASVPKVVDGFYHFHVCLIVYFATPSKREASSSIFYELKASREDVPGVSVLSEKGGDRTKPHVLVHDNTNVFNTWWREWTTSTPSPKPPSHKTQYR